MSRVIKILHIDPDYQITYLIYRQGSSIRTSVSLQTAIALLKKEDFDLIVSEPHNKAILKKENPVTKTNPLKVGLPFKEQTMAVSGKSGQIDIPKIGAGTGLYSPGPGSAGRPGRRTI